MFNYSRPVRLSDGHQRTSHPRPIAISCGRVRLHVYITPHHELCVELLFFRLINECDGILVATPECYEPTETVHAMREWFAETSRPVYAFGPLLPPFGQHATVNEKKQSANSGNVDELLERALKAHG